MEIQKIDQAALEKKAAAEDLRIQTVEDANTVAVMLKDVKALFEEIDSTFDPIIAQAHKAHKEALAQKKRHRDPLELVDRILRDKLAAWQAAERRKAEAERRRLEEEARKAEEDRLLAEAEKFQKAGFGDYADSILETPVVPVLTGPGPSAPKIDGVSSRTYYSAEVLDKTALILAAIKNPELMRFLEPNQTALNGWARETQGKDTIPGVRVVSREAVAV